VDPESREAADGLLLVGRVARAHGIRGHVIINPETDFMEARFRPGQVILRVPRVTQTFDVAVEFKNLPLP